MCRGTEFPALAVYGGGWKGVTACTDPGWPAGTLAVDDRTTDGDGDPSLRVADRTLVVADDRSSGDGAWRIVMEVRTGF